MPRLRSPDRSGGERVVIHEGTPDAVCPRCGEIFEDSWEYSDGDEEECPECSCKFDITVNKEESYTTKETEENEPDNNGRG